MVVARILNIRNIDLNLLPVLLALIEEQSVTGASKRVHLSQSATQVQPCAGFERL